MMQFADEFTGKKIVPTLSTQFSPMELNSLDAVQRISNIRYGLTGVRLCVSKTLQIVVPLSRQSPRNPLHQLPELPLLLARKPPGRIECLFKKLSCARHAFADLAGRVLHAKGCDQKAAVFAGGKRRLPGHGEGFDAPENEAGKKVDAARVFSFGARRKEL